jgi:hypothetical protein
VYTWYTGGFIVFVLALGGAGADGLPKNWIGFIFLLATVALYAGIGIMSRTTDAAEYYVAGRRVPALYNGMATGADWMSAAVVHRHGRHAVPLGLRRPGLHHGLDRRLLLVAAVSGAVPAQVRPVHDPRLPRRRFEGNLPRFIGIIGAILCSFTYVVAQIYGVGLITARLTGAPSRSASSSARRHPGGSFLGGIARGHLGRRWRSTSMLIIRLPGAGGRAVGSSRNGVPVAAVRLRLPAAEVTAKGADSQATRRRTRSSHLQGRLQRPHKLKDVRPRWRGPGARAKKVPT